MKVKEGFYYTIHDSGILMIAEIEKSGEHYLIEYIRLPSKKLRTIFLVKSAMIKTIKRSQLKFLGD